MKHHDALGAIMATLRDKDERKDDWSSALSPEAAREDEILVTILLRHDQSNNLDAVQSKLKDVDWWERFPPEGVKIVSWYVAMGLGQVVTLSLHPSRLQALNLELERSAWGVFRTECYPSYDFVPVRERIRERVRQGGK